MWKGQLVIRFWEQRGRERTMRARRHIINEDWFGKRTLKSEGWPLKCVWEREREWMRLRRSQSFASLPSMLSQDKVNKQCRVEGQGSLTLKTKHHPHQTPCLRNKENKPAAGPRSTDIRALLSSTLTTKKKTLQEAQPKNAKSVIYSLKQGSSFLHSSDTKRV